MLPPKSESTGDGFDPQSRPRYILICAQEQREIIASGRIGCASQRNQKYLQAQMVKRLGLWRKEQRCTTQRKTKQSKGNYEMVWQVDPEDYEYITHMMNDQGYAQIHHDPMEEWFFDQLLAARSTFEFIRPELDQDTLTMLDACDAYWQANPKVFNAFFLYEHARKDIKIALEDWVEDENSQHPIIPKDHWWWWPVEGVV